jgi:hypothetical protein
VLRTTNHHDHLERLTASLGVVQVHHDQESGRPGLALGNTPSTRPHTPANPPRLEILPPSLDHEDGRLSPVLQPLASSPYVHSFLNPSPMNEIRREVSMTSLVVDVQNPSTESLPISPSTTNPITDEPLAMEPAFVVDQHDEPVPDSSTSSNASTLDYYLPEGRFVQLINSDQIPRYDKNALMQVEYTILSPHPYISLQTSRGYTL